MGSYESKGRHAKGKARLSAYEKLLGQETREKEDKLESVHPRRTTPGQQGDRSHRCSKGYGDKLLYENLDVFPSARGIVGIIGPNGAGKTTLFKMIIGKNNPDAGTFQVGETVRIAYVDQEHDDLNPEDSYGSRYPVEMS
jgi:ATPase subunit of ABC transporter with duplicated ATPase domains